MRRGRPFGFSFHNGRAAGAGGRARAWCEERGRFCGRGLWRLNFPCIDYEGILEKKSTALKSAPYPADSLIERLFIVGLLRSSGTTTVPLRELCVIKVPDWLRMRRVRVRSIGCGGGAAAVLARPLSDFVIFVTPSFFAALSASCFAR